MDPVKNCWNCKREIGAKLLSCPLCGINLSTGEMPVSVLKTPRAIIGMIVGGLGFVLLVMIIALPNLPASHPAAAPAHAEIPHVPYGASPPSSPHAREDILGKEGCDEFASLFSDARKNILTVTEFRERVKAARNYTRGASNADVVRGGDTILAEVTGGEISGNSEGLKILAKGCEQVRK